MPAPVRFALSGGASKPCAAGTIVAKKTSYPIDAIVDLGDRVAVTHSGPTTGAPRGTTTLARSTFAVQKSRKGPFGPLDASADPWIATSEYYKGRLSSLCLIDPTTLAEIDRFPLVAPYVRLDARRIIAHTPVQRWEFVGSQMVTLPDYEIAEKELGELELPAHAGLVELDVEKRAVKLLVASSEHDEFRHSVLSPDRKIVYACSSFGRVVAVDLVKHRVLWERPPVRLVTDLSVHAIALEPTGKTLAIAGSSATEADLLLLDATTGKSRIEHGLCHQLDRAGVTKRNARIETLVYHASGWLAIGTSGGAVAELQPDGVLTAFRAATAGIRAMTFLDDGAFLLVGGSEPQLRLWPVDL